MKIVATDPQWHKLRTFVVTRETHNAVVTHLSVFLQKKISKYLLFHYKSSKITSFGVKIKMNHEPIKFAKMS